MAQTDKQTIGKRGEEMAEMFLKKQNFTILGRNYWKKWGEIDLIAEKGGVIHFVEVKTVTRIALNSGPIGEDYEPEDNIHLWKRQRLGRVIQTYLLEKKVGDEVDWQVDAIAVYLKPDGGVLKIDYLDDITL